MHRLQNRVVMSQEALDAYRRKQHENTTLAESATFVCDLQAACAMLGALSLGKQFHVQMEQRNLLADAAVVTGLDEAGKHTTKRYHILECPRSVQPCGTIGRRAEVLQGDDVAAWDSSYC